MKHDSFLGDLAQVVDCEHKTAPPAEPGKEYAFSVGTPALRGAGIDFSQAKPVDETTYLSWSRRAELRRGDIILAREAPVGGVGFIDGARRVCLGQRTVLVRPNHEIVDSRYLFYLLRSPRPQSWMEMHSEGSTVKHLNVADVRRIALGSIPPLAEQRRIARTLGAIDDLIEVNNVLARDLRSLADTAYMQAVHGVTDTRPLADFIDLKYGKSLIAALRRPGLIPVISSAGIVDWHDTPLVSGPGIAIGRKGTVGSVTWSPGAFFPIDTAFYVETSGSMIFAYFSLVHAGLSDMNTDSAVPGLNRGNALARRVPWVDSEAQQRFESLALPLWNAAGSLASESAELEASRDELLPQLIAGRVSVGRVPA